MSEARTLMDLPSRPARTSPRFTHSRIVSALAPAYSAASSVVIHGSAFDNADDYHGFSEAAGALADVAGTLYSAPFQDFTRSVTAVYGNVTVTGFASAIPGLTVTVTVQEAGLTWSVTRFIAEPPS